ncbi:MAG: hypothetical protein ACJ768_24560 [Gaiellaceae bacterium]
MRRNAPSHTAAVTAVADQTRAAHRHATAVRGQIHSILGATEQAPASPAVVRMVARHMRAEPVGCPHVRPGRPLPLLAVAWLPGRVVCGPCSVALLTCPADAEHVCDGCGRDLPGALHIGTVQIGLTILHFGVCRRCLAGQPAEVATAGSQRAGGAR